MRPIVARGSADQVKVARSVEDPKNEQVRESFDVGQAEFKFRNNLERSFSIMARSKTFWYGSCVGVRAVNMPDWHGNKHHSLHLTWACGKPVNPFSQCIESLRGRRRRLLFGLILEFADVSEACIKSAKQSVTPPAGAEFKGLLIEFEVC